VQARDSRLSSAHINFHMDEEDSAFGPDWLARTDVQYHWRNEAGWKDFDGFLAAFDHKHRKNIRQERAKVQRAGIDFRVVHGDEASDEDLATMFAFYLLTFRDYGNSPALTLEFIRHLARAMPRNLVIFLAEREGLKVFEPGAQGEHKLARGFLPTFVRSRHWIADADFADALKHWCAEETRSVQRYAATLASHSPFRHV
jgi:predicted N-acyltransferase